MEHLVEVVTVDSYLSFIPFAKNINASKCSILVRSNFSTPKAFGKRKKQKKIGVHEALDDKDLRTITKLIRNVVGDIYRDIWLKRNSWK